MFKSQKKTKNRGCFLLFKRMTSPRLKVKRKMMKKRKMRTEKTKKLTELIDNHSASYEKS